MQVYSGLQIAVWQWSDCVNVQTEQVFGIYLEKMFLLAPALTLFTLSTGADRPEQTV